MAVRRQDEVMVNLLLQQENIVLYDTIFYAIEEKNVEIVKILLRFYDAHQPLLRQYSVSSMISMLPNTIYGIPTKNQSPGRIPGTPAQANQNSSPASIASGSSVGSVSRIFVDEEFDAKYKENITALLAAAHKGSVELIEIFYMRGERLETIDATHDEMCPCELCIKLVMVDFVKNALKRENNDQLISLLLWIFI